MKIVNSDYGVDMVASRESVPWYHWPRFPLLPLFEIRPADEWNEPNFSFSWLNFRMWSMMSPDIGASIYLEDRGIVATVRLPYLIMKIWLFYFPRKWHQKLWRCKK